METPEPPPTTHTLRPHHLCLLMIIMLVIKHMERTTDNNDFLMHVLPVLIYEVAEVSRPKTYTQLLAIFYMLPHSQDPGAVQFFESIKPMHVDFVSVDHLANFFASVFFLVADNNRPSGQSDLARRSLLGYYCRRCHTTYQKMSYNGIAKLMQDYHDWIYVNPLAGYHPVRKDIITYDTVLHKTHADEYQWAIPDPYAVFERGLAIADTNVASESLRRFFEQHFHDSSDSGVRQHALLNLSRMHYLHHEYAAARKYLAEAIDVSRIANDKETLQHCQSLLNRLPTLVRGSRPALNEIQPGVHPLELLFDVQKLMRVSSEQPLNAAFEKITQAVGLYDHWIDVQQNVPEDSEQWAHHAVQSIVWSAAGCDRLAAIEEDIVTAFTEVAGDDNCTITVALNRAYRRARQGKYEESVATLLEPDVWRGLALDDYVKWATEIWNILVLRASRRGQERQYTDFLKARMPSTPWNPRSYFFNTPAPPESIIRDPLHEVMRMRHTDQAAISVDKLLKALWHAEFQCRYGTYRTGIILLADLGLEFGMTKRSRRIVEEIMPQVISGNDLEQRAFACFTYARCIMAAGNKSQDSIREAISYIEMAEKDYKTIEILRSLAETQYYLAVMYHNLGMEAERDAAAERHEKTEEERQKAAICGVETWVKDVWDLVCEVGVALVAR